jgi:hypothetical protein
MSFLLVAQEALLQIILRLMHKSATLSNRKLRPYLQTPVMELPMYLISKILAITMTRALLMDLLYWLQLEQ